MLEDKKLGKKKDFKKGGMLFLKEKLSYFMSQLECILV